MIFVSMFLSVFFIVYIGTMYISIKLNKIYSQFPLAIQLFTDEYVTYKAIKIAIDNSFKKMPKSIAKSFENLSRRLSSSQNEDDYRKAINDFANGLDFIWGYAFSEVLLLSYDGVGDITEDLIYLNGLTIEEIKNKMETEASLTFTKGVFIVLQIATLIAFVCNIIFLPTAEKLYFYTSVGNLGIILWLSSMILGLALLSIMKYI